MSDTLRASRRVSLARRCCRPQSWRPCLGLQEVTVSLYTHLARELCQETFSTARCLWTSSTSPGPLVSGNISVQWKYFNSVKIFQPTTLLAPPLPCLASSSVAAGLIRAGESWGPRDTSPPGRQPSHWDTSGHFD